MFPGIEILGKTIPTYGLCVLVGGILGFLIAMWAGKKYGLAKLDILLFGMYAIIAGFIGAKLLYIIVEWDSVWQHPEALLTGGFVFYGGAIGGILGGWIYVKQYSKMSKLYLIEFLDVAAPAIAIGQAFGRVGCFLAGCCYGAPTDSPLGVCYPEGGIAPAGVKLLPTQLFETAFLLVFTVVLLIIIKKSKKRGTALAIYFIGYGVWRFIIEFFRSQGKRRSAFHLTVYQPIHCGIRCDHSRFAQSKGRGILCQGPWRMCRGKSGSSTRRKRIQ